MKFLKIGLSLGLALAACSSTTFASQAPTEPTAADASQAPVSTRPMIGKMISRDERMAAAEALITAPLSVNGVVISGDEVRRALLLKAGRGQIESRKLDLMITAEIEKLKAEGADMSGLSLTPEEEQAAFDTATAQIKAQYPNMAIEDVLASNNLSLESLKRQLTQTKLFDRVFLPADADAWPATTINALGAQMDETMLTTMRDNWKAKAEAGDGTPGAGNAMWDKLMRQMVIQALMKDAVVLTPVDGLPANVVQRVNGHDTLVADVWPEVRSLVHPEDVKRMRTYLARMAAVTQDLTAKGAWLDDETFGAIFDAEEAQGAGSPLNLNMIVMVMKRYPNMDAYKSILRAERSYEKMIQTDITDVALEAWLPRASRLLGLGEVGTEMILLSAFDYSMNRWHDNGWAQAEERANTVVDALVEGNGENWDELLEANSDFYDAPQQANAQSAQAPKRRNKGRFGMIHRNILMQMLGESEYTAFVDGASISDEVYYNQEIGIDGPFKGMHGYYITRVDSRSNAKKPILLSDPIMRKMVREDYIMQTFIGYSNTIFEAATVIGL